MLLTFFNWKINQFKHVFPRQFYNIIASWIDKKVKSFYNTTNNSYWFKLLIVPIEMDLERKN